MYTLSEKQLSSVEELVDKLDDSMIKSRMQAWIDKIDPQRVLSEQLEEFVGFATHLPKEHRDYPQSWAFSVKNGDEVNGEESDEETKDDSIKQTKKKPAVKKVKGTKKK